LGDDSGDEVIVSSCTGLCPCTFYLGVGVEPSVLICHAFLDELEERWIQLVQWLIDILSRQTLRDMTGDS